MSVDWITLFLDYPAASFDDAVPFWCAITQTELSPVRGDSFEFATLLPSTGDAHLRVQRIESGQPRVHIDLHSTEHRRLADRARELGAAMVADHGYMTLLSPGGLEFCLVAHHGEARRSPKVALNSKVSYRVDQVCVDASVEMFDQECEFWSSLTGWVLNRHPSGQFAALIRPDDFPVRVLLQQTDDLVKTTSAHIDIACGVTVAEVVEAHLRLGAKVVRTTPIWTTLRDPSGLEYCLTPRDPDTGLRLRPPEQFVNKTRSDERNEQVQTEMVGGLNRVIRMGETVIRPTGRHSAAVHEVLKHLEKVGFVGAPKVLSVDDVANTETLSFVPGEVANYPLPETFTSDEAMCSAARLLSELHDALASFQIPLEAEWFLPAVDPAEIVVHGDFAPYNCTVDDGVVTGVFDFDTVHPAPRLWDVAYAAYRWVPLVDPTNPDRFGSNESQVARLKMFCESYGTADIEGVLELAYRRLFALVASIRQFAADGHPAFQEHLRDGHDELYLRDAAHIEKMLQGLRGNP